MLTSRYKPSKCHSRHHHNEQALRMLCHIPLWQLDAYRKETGCEHDTHNLSSKSICNPRPSTWVEDAGDVRSQEDAKARSKGDLIHIQLRLSVSSEKIHCGMHLTLSLITKDIKLYFEDYQMCLGNMEGHGTHGNNKTSQEGICQTGG